MYKLVGDYAWRVATGARKREEKIGQKKATRLLDVSSLQELSEPRRNVLDLWEPGVRSGMLVQRWGVDLCGIRSLPPLIRDPGGSIILFP